MKMNQSVRTMLENLYGLFKAKFNDTEKSWDNFIDFLAVENKPSLLPQIEHKFEWLYSDLNLCESILKIYDAKSLKCDYYDYLGDMYLEKILKNADIKTSGVFRSPGNIDKVLGQACIPKTNKEINILDPAASTGRVLLAAYKIAPNASCFGVEKDLRLLRIAMTNFAIHELEGYFLHADSLKHEIDISKENGQYNWQFVNSWNSQLHKLKPITAQNNPALKIL